MQEEEGWLGILPRGSALASHQGTPSKGRPADSAPPGCGQCCDFSLLDPGALLSHTAPKILQPLNLCGISVLWWLLTDRPGYQT